MDPGATPIVRDRRPEPVADGTGAVGEALFHPVSRLAQAPSIMRPVQSAQATQIKSACPRLVITAWTVVAIRLLRRQRSVSQYLGNAKFGLNRSASAMGRRIQIGPRSRGKGRPGLIGRPARAGAPSIRSRLATDGALRIIEIVSLCLGGN